MTPSVFIASVYDNNHPLFAVLLEADGIHNVVNSKTGWKCFPIHKANIESITAKFKNPDEFNFHIFHFAGHAFDKYLQLNDALGSIDELENMTKTANYLVHTEGLATILTAAQHNLKLVFLNGCSTEKQVEIFKNAGIPAIIYTNYALKDSLGVRFAKKFYDAFFNSPNTLEAAFNFAKGDVEGMKDNLQGGWTDKDLEDSMTRGGLKLTPPGKPLYSLDAPDELKQQKLSDWAKTAGMTAPPKPDIPTIKEPDHKALLCNRKQQTDEFMDALAAMTQDPPPPLPLFFFIHDLIPASPQRLCERLFKVEQTEFIKNRKLKPDLIEWRPVHLPDSRHWQDDNICFERLKEIYSTITSFDTGLSLKSDKVLLVHHDLNKLYIDWSDDLRRLLNIYVGNFSQTIAAELSARVAVFFSVGYFDKNSPFKAFFDNLSQTHQGRVYNFTDMPDVTAMDVYNWLTRVFEDRIDAPTINEIIQEYPSVQQGVPMDSAVKILYKIVDKYNQNLQAKNG
jgi:hypothetical protein